MEEEALSSRLNTQEKLLIAQAVYKFGALDWNKISGLLVNHPVVEGRPAEWFDTKTCEAYYVGLMTEAGINVPAQDASKAQANVHLRLAQTFYFDRLQELKSSIAVYEQRFTTLMSEIAAIKSGSMDKTIKDEIRAVLARKFGKQLLDSWVPDEDAVKAAVEAGPPAPVEVEEQGDPTANDASPAVPRPVDSELAEETSDEETPIAVAEQVEPAEPATTAEHERESEDVEMTETPVEANSATPAPEATEVEEPPSSPPASEFTPTPEDQPPQISPSKSKDEEIPNSSTRASKRKASAQPRGAPTTKRSTRRKTSSTPAAVEPEPVIDSKEEAENESEEVKHTENVSDEESTVYLDDGSREVDEPENVEGQEEETPPARGRRATKRDSNIGGPSKRPSSPASSTRQSSPPTGKRGTSVPSVKSPTPVEDRRSSRRGAAKGRGMRDEVVSKSVREQSAAVESVKEEEDSVEQDRPPTRSSRRAKDNTTPVPDVSAPLPDQRKGTRRSSTRAGGNHAELEEEKPQPEQDEKDRRQPKRPRHSSPRETKATQRMLNGLLDQISGHRNGNIFAQPVKEKEAPGYFEVIKRPMDLKKIRQRIRDGHITTIDEFERDVMLMFANATMFNAKGTATHDMAMEMMRDADSHISHLKNVQLNIGR